MRDLPPRRSIIPIKVAPTPAPEAACCGDGDEPHGHPHHDHGHGEQGHHGHHAHSHDHVSHEHEHAQEHAHVHAAHDGCCAPAALNPPASATPPAAPLPDGSASVRWRIDKMDCPTEERLIRNKLEPMAGVLRLDFNLLARELTVHHQLDDVAPVEAALVALDMAPRLLEAGQPATALPPALPTRTKLLLSAGGMAAAAAEALAWSTGQDSHPMVIALAGIAIATAGLPTLKKGWIALRHLALNIYFLMTLAVAGAVAIGKWPEAAMVVFLFALAEAVEAVSLERARKAIESLAVLAPDTALAWRHGQWQSTPVGSVAVGDKVMVRTGERVPLDAKVLKGQGAVDQAPITGESMPVDKQPGDEVYAGTIVVSGVLETEVTATAGHSMMARIAAAIQQAQAQRAPTQRFVDEFARYYTPAVVVMALLLALCGPWLLGGSAVHWLYQALVLLVIACPCALVVSTPVTVVSGLANAARHGILIKGGVHLEQGRLLKVVALDKTGTLTEGRPSLTDVIALDGARHGCGTAHGAGQGEDEGADAARAHALRIAASLDQHSSHPIARALVASWRERAPQGQLLPVDHFAVLNGRGVKGEVQGQTWHLGNLRLLKELGLRLPPELEASLNHLDSQGKTPFVLSNDAQGPVAVLAMADRLRPQSKQAIDDLNALAVESVMLSGDSQGTVNAIALQSGVSQARGGLLPQDKLDTIAEIIRQRGHVAMVGDGVNDAPAMARATIGIAMGAAGTATALETADVAIMDDDPRKIAQFIRLSRATSSVLKQNIALALGIKAVFLTLAFTGHATLWMAVFADVGASLLVVFNGLKLLRFKA